MRQILWLILNFLIKSKLTQDIVKMMFYGVFEYWIVVGFAYQGLFQSESYTRTERQNFWCLLYYLYCCHFEMEENR